MRVLIATDRDILAGRLRAQLGALGHKVVGIVKDGPAAAAFVRHSPPDVIFLDQHLPPREAIHAAREILAKRIIPTILLIGYPAAGLVKNANEAGILAYLVWPAEARMMEAAIEMAQTRFREFRILYEHIGDLREALRTRIVVGRAKTILMRRLGFREVEAFGYLVRQSRAVGTPVNEIAEGLVAAEDLWFGPGSADIMRNILHVLTRRGVLVPAKIS